MTENKTLIVGIAGNPNSGKTTLFNALTGSNQRSGNYPGVTVEKKQGIRKYKNYTFIIYDLPGTYSLTAYSIDEIVARDFLLNDRPDIIIDVLDATNIERNLYLCLQLQELGIPLIGALNIVDQAERRGITIDEQQMGKLLSIPMLKTVGIKSKGIEELLDKIIETLDDRRHDTESSTYYGMEVEKEINKLTEWIETDESFSEHYLSRWLSIKLLEKDNNAFDKLKLHSAGTEIRQQAEKSINWLEKHFGDDTEIIISEQRYGFIHGAVKETVKTDAMRNRKTRTEKVDRILLHRIFGWPIFLLIIWLIFQATFTLGQYPVQWLELLFEFIAAEAGAVLPAETLIHSFVVDGIIGGVGGVLVFLPLVLILFTGISLMEDTGYMSRSAFLLDKFFHFFGLHGQSFIPLFIGFGCTVPAVMSARTLKNPRDRIVTILVLSLISCGARLPVYALLIGAFFPADISGHVLFSIYLIGVVLALLLSFIFKKTLFKGTSSPFVMELPPYRLPTLRGILWHVGRKAWSYIRKAGTVILGASVIVWAVTTFPMYEPDTETTEKLKTELMNEELAMVPDTLMTNEIRTHIENDVDRKIEVIQNQQQLKQSIAGHIGSFIEPVMKPIGFDWKISVALITGWAAKEIIVSTLGVIYKVGSDETENSESLRDALRNDPTFTPLVAYVLMLFVLIYVPCIATLAVIKSELGSWKWMVFVIFYTLTLAYIIALVVYQTGRLLF